MPPSSHSNSVKDDDNFGEEVYTGQVKAARLPQGGPASRMTQRKVSGGPIAQVCAESPNICAHLLTFASFVLILITMPFSLLYTIRVVQEYERVVIFRLGRLLMGGAKGPGVFFIIPCVDIYQKIDMRTATYEIPPQEILTKDSVTVFVNAIMFYKVRDPISAVSNVDDYSASARLLSATTLRNVLGTKSLKEILSDRETIARDMQELLYEATGPWGVDVERVEVKDVRVPEQLMRAMAAEAEAARLANAKVVAAEGEHRASRSLHLAANSIKDRPAALQLRYLQALTNVSIENNKTIVFPIPLQLIKKLGRQCDFNDIPDTAGSE